MSTGPYQHNGSVEACTAFLASQHRPKPTDSEQLAKTTDRNGDVLVGDILDIIDKDPSRYRVAQALAKYVRERDQQRFTKTMEIVHTVKPATRDESAIDRYEQRLENHLTAALGPDNSKIEE